MTPHTLRRTFISLLLANHADVPYVMDQVGHVDEGTTLRVYAKVLNRDRRHVGAAVDEMIADPLTSRDKPQHIPEGRDETNYGRVNARLD